MLYHYDLIFSSAVEMGYTYVNLGWECDWIFLTHWADVYLEISICHMTKKKKINIELKLHLIFPQQAKPQTGHSNKVWCCSAPLLLHLLVLLRLGGLCLKVHWLAQFWAFSAAAGHHSLMKEENICHTPMNNPSYIPLIKEQHLEITFK